MTLPNYITVARFVMVPLIIFALINGEMLAAFLLFMLAGISDGIWTASLPGISTSVRSWDPGLIPMADKFMLVSVFHDARLAW
jgi:cardiolipin synthase